MDNNRFSQEELNRIVAVRVKRERERLTTEFESRIKKCMASIHLMLHQEMRALKGNTADEEVNGSGAKYSSKLSD